MPPILSYRHVDISYYDKRTVRDISFDVEAGEILGIVGESGSGKSTLIKAAMGLLGPAGQVTRGDIYYGNKNLCELPRAKMLKLNGPEMGMIFQSAGASFCPVRKIGAQLYEAVSQHRQMSREAFDKSAQELLKKLSFEDARRILDSYPFQLSGGMQQRVGCAAAMLLNPRVLFADEPTSALDVYAQKQVIDEMLNIRRRFGCAIIIVTNNIGVVNAMADRVLVMKDGERVEYGDTRQIIDHPEMPYTRRLMAAVPKLPARIKT